MSWPKFRWGPDYESEPAPKDPKPWRIWIEKAIYVAVAALVIYLIWFYVGSQQANHCNVVFRNDNDCVPRPICGPVYAPGLCDSTPTVRNISTSLGRAHAVVN